jgi:hypothetical protein
LKAGRADAERRVAVSVSPSVDLEAVADSDADDEAEAGIQAGEATERIGLPKDDEVVRRILDPKLPSAEEVERHYVSGHLPYRNWCPVCVRARGKELDHSQDGGKDRRIPEYSVIIAFQG